MFFVHTKLLHTHHSLSHPSSLSRIAVYYAIILIEGLPLTSIAVYLPYYLIPSHSLCVIKLSEGAAFNHLYYSSIHSFVSADN